MVRTLLEFYFYDFIIMKGLDRMVRWSAYILLLQVLTLNRNSGLRFAANF